MRKIEYIFIDSDRETRDGKPGRHAVPNLGYHYVVNSEGLVLNPTDVCIPAHIIQGPVYDPDKYNHCSIFIRYCGSLRTESWLLNLEPLNIELAKRSALLNLLVDLRQHFPDAKILGVSEIDGRELYCKNIIVSDAMNVLRRELSDYP